MQSGVKMLKSINIQDMRKKIGKKITMVKRKKKREILHLMVKTMMAMTKVVETLLMFLMFTLHLPSML